MRPNLILSLCALFLLVVWSPNTALPQCWTPTQKLVPTKSFNTTEGLGSSIDHEGDIAVIAAPQSDSLRTSSGAVYVFEFKNGEWKKIAKLTASDHREYQYFGHQVLIHNDQIFVADPQRNNQTDQRGAIYVFNKPSGGWKDMTETLILMPSYSRPYQFGFSMDIHEDVLLVGSPYTVNESNIQTGVAFVFEKHGYNWTQTAMLKSPYTSTSTFGSNVVLGENLAVVVADEEARQTYTAIGASYVFEKSAGSHWTDSYPVARLTESSQKESLAYLGRGLAIDETRNTIFISQLLYDQTGPYKAILVYQKPSTGWDNITETNKYVNYLFSHVFMQTLRFEEPYLYSGGGPLVEVFKPSESNQWTLTNPTATLTTSDFTLQQQFGIDISVQNGRVLVSAPSVVTQDRDTQIKPGLPYIHEFTVPATEWVSVGNTPVRSFTYMPVTATDYFYGVDIDIDGDIAVVGSPYDRMTKTNAGAVYVYRLTNSTWTKIATLVPSDGEPYDNFGRTVSISKDHIAVGSPYKSYRDASGQITDFDLGAIYVFKKPPGGWSDMEESYKIVRSEGRLDGDDQDRDDDNLGTTVELDFPHLVASRFDHNSRPNAGSVLVFNISGDLPVLEATLNPSFREAVNNFGESLCMRDSVIAIGCGTTRFWMGETNAVFMYVRRGEHWRDTTETTLLTPSDNGNTGYLPGIAFGQSIDMTEDGSQIIIGAPGWFDGVIFQTTNYFKGAAYIFERPANGWKGLIREKARLTIPGQEAYACMGFSVHIEDRYAVVGSPQNYFYTYGAENPGTGRAYFYQKPADGWKYKLPDKVITGDESGSALSDYFGAAVDGVHGFMMIGAFADDNQNSVDAGSVYVYIENSFINPIETPICENATPRQLTAFPGGGTWTSKGIANSSDGVFDPSLAGPGKHVVSYSVDECDIPNTLIIEVKEFAKPTSIIKEDSIYFCGNAEIRLAAHGKQEFSYSWTYSPTGESYAATGSIAQTIQATKRGYYKVMVSTDCASATDTVWVGDLFPDGGDDFELCISDGLSQRLGNYPTGSWSGPGIISSGVFDPTKAGKGNHDLYYSVSPIPGCAYQDTVQVHVSALPDFAINPQGTESFCYNGNATLSIPNIPGAQYMWYFGTTADALNLINPTEAAISANQFGTYKVVATDGLCSKEASYLFVRPTFQPSITPVFDSVAFCDGESISLQAEPILGARYVWSDYRNDNPEILKETVGEFLETITESGKFKLLIDSYGCIFESKFMTTRKIPADSIFVPNVITPNGDQWNEEFVVYTEGIDQFQMKVLSRYGQEVWSGTRESQPWNASNSNGGVYYWILSYQSQCGGNKTHKGWIQVLK